MVVNLQKDPNPILNKVNIVFRLLKKEKQIFWFFLLTLIVLFSFQLIDWPNPAIIIIIAGLFSFINLIGFFKAKIEKSNWDYRYLIVSLLYLFISLKIQFSYYNVILLAGLLILTMFLVIYKKNHLNNTKLQIRLVLLLFINLFILFYPDKFVFKYINSSGNSFWDENISWSNFKGDKPVNTSIGAGAGISSRISFKYNYVYNFPSIISLSVMDEYKSWALPIYMEGEGNLLNHEKLHFDITEWTRREFQDSLANEYPLSEFKILFIYHYFEDLKFKRQLEYDSISNHGSDFAGQIYWNKLVDEKLILN